MVEDDEQGHGVGTALLESLVQRAPARGIRRFRAAFLRQNERMPDVFAHAGFDVHWDHATPAWAASTSNWCPPTRGSRPTRTVTTSPRHVRSRRLLSPRSIAVVGAGRDERSVGRAIVTNLVQGGFRAPCTR